MAVERRFPPWMPNEILNQFLLPLQHPPTREHGCNSDRALLIGLTRLFSKQQRSSTSTSTKRLERAMTSLTRIGRDRWASSGHSCNVLDSSLSRSGFVLTVPTLPDLKHKFTDGSVPMRITSGQ